MSICGFVQVGKTECVGRGSSRFESQGGSTRQQNNARLLTGGRRAAREESFDYYSVAGDPARGMRRGGARAGAPDPRTGGAVPRRRASVPTGLLCVIEGWANRDRGVALFTSTADDINNQLPGLGAREDARPTHSIPTVYLSIIGYIERYIGGAHGERTESADGSHGPTSRPDR